jgi:uncharacterized membrane protein
MSNGKSDRIARKAGGSQVYGLGGVGLDDKTLFRRLDLLAKNSDAQIKKRIESLLREFASNPSKAKAFGLSEVEIRKLAETWGDSSKPKSSDELKKIDAAIDGFLDK